MTTRQVSRRILLQGTAIGGGAVLLAACTSGGGSSKAAPTGVPSAEGGEVVLNPGKLTLKESPDFAARVAAGELEPVAQRIGQDPLVIRPVHGIGQYGGEIRRGVVDNDFFASTFCAGPDGFLYWDSELKNIVPNIARDYEVSSDNREITLHLRRGMRWSDGEPFTADDIIFWREDINLDPDLGFPSATLQIDGKNVEIEKVDDYTVVYRSPVPYATLIEKFASPSDASGPDTTGSFGGGGYAPKHYLSQFLPKYTSEAEANKKAKAAGFDSWTTYVLDRNTWVSNPDLPTLTPWTCTRSVNDPPWVFEANPYSIWVDSDGNQLPYIPKVSNANVDSSEVLALNAVSGDYDWGDRGIALQSLPLLIKNQERGGFTVNQAPDQIMDMAIVLNLSFDDDPEMGDLIRTVEFRRALSLGVDRDQVNDTYFVGTATPSATMVADSSPYFPGAEYRTKWATLDLDQANQLLDGIGLTERNSDGFRMLPSGKGPVRLEMQSTVSKADFPTMGEMVRRHWRKIGIEATSDVVDSALLYERAQANKVMATVNNVYGVDDPFLNVHCVLPYSTAGVVAGTFGIEYSKWFLSGGKEGVEPPESMSMLKDGVALYEQGLQTPRDQRVDLGKQIMQMHADQVWTVGVAAMGLLDYGVYFNTNTLANVPATIRNSFQTQNTALAQPFAFYYK